MTQFGSSAIAGIFLALFAQPLHASAIRQDAFAAAAQESFQGLSPGPNISLLFGGVLKPGVNRPFTFPRASL